MTPPAENQGRPEVSETVGKTRHVFEKASMLAHDDIFSGEIFRRCKNKRRLLPFVSLWASDLFGRTAQFLCDHTAISFATFLI